MTNRRAIHSAATSEANTLTHHASTTSRLAIATPSTSQSSKNQMIGVAMPRSMRERLQQFLKFEARLIGAAAPRGFRFELWKGCCIQKLRAARRRGNRVLYACSGN